MPLLPPKTQLLSVSYHLGRVARGLCCHWSSSDCDCLIPGTFTNQVQAACRGLVSPGGCGPQGRAPASQRCLRVTCQPSLCVTSSVLSGRGHPTQQQRSWHSWSEAVDAGPGSSVHEWPRLPWTPSWEAIPELSFYREPKETENEEQAIAAKAVTKEEFPGECAAPGPEFTATQSEVADSFKVMPVSSVPIQQFPMKSGVPSPPPKTGLPRPLLRPLNE